METPEACTARVNEPDNSAAAVDTLASVFSHSFPAAAAAAVAATKDFQTKSAFSQCAAVSEAQPVSVCPLGG